MAWGDSPGPRTGLPISLHVQNDTKRHPHLQCTQEKENTRLQKAGEPLTASNQSQGAGPMLAKSQLGWGSEPVDGES